MGGIARDELHGNARFDKRRAEARSHRSRAEDAHPHSSNPAAGRDRFHRLVDVLSVAGDGDVGIFFIEGLPLFVQPLDVFDVPAHDDAAFCKAGDTPLHLFGTEFQINDGADLLQMPHGAVGIDDAAPRRNDAVRRHDARIDALFDADKAVNALVFDDLGKFFALFALDDEVAVDEAVADALGEQHARRALARGGHSDEYEVIHISHYNKNRPDCKAENAFSP